MEIINIITVVLSVLGGIAAAVEIMKYLSERRSAGILKSGNVNKFRVPTIYPRPTNSFVGRTDEINFILNLLRNDESISRIAICGMGGLGKSTLARKVSDTLARNYQIIWTNFGETPDIINILDAWAQQIGINISEFDDATVKAGVVRQALSQQKGKQIIIIDDIWDIDLLQFIIDHAKPENIKLLITTRSIEIARHCDFKIVELSTFSDKDVIEYFRQYFTNVMGADKDIKLVGRLVGNLPLALELIVHMIDHLNELSELIEIIQDINHSDTSHKYKNPFEAKLETCLSISYKHIPESAQKCFRLTGAFSNNCFHPQAISKIANEDMRNEIRLLINRGLLSRFENDDLSQHVILNNYARNLLIQHGEDKISKLAHANYYFALPNNGNWVLWDRYFDQIIQSWNTLLHFNDRSIFNNLKKLIAYFEIRVRWLDIIKYSLQALNFAIKEELLVEQAWLYSLLGLYSWQIGRENDAQEYIEKGISLARETLSPYYEASCLNTLGLITRVKHDFPGSLSYFTQSFQIRERIGDQLGQAYCLHNIGVSLYHSGNNLDANKRLRDSIQLFTQINNNDNLSDNDRISAQTGLLLSMSSYAQVCRSDGNKVEVKNVCLEGLKIAKEIGDSAAICRLQGNLGRVYLEENNVNNAIKAFDESSIAAEKIGHLRGQIRAHIWGGQALLKTMNYNEAIQRLLKGLEIQQLVSDPVEQSFTHRILGRTYSSIGDANKSLHHFTIAVDLSHKSNHYRGESLGLYELHKLALDSDSEKYLSQALQFLNLAGYSSFEKAEKDENDHYPI